MTEEQKLRQLMLLSAKAEIATRNNLLATAQWWREAYENVRRKPASEMILTKEGAAMPHTSEMLRSKYLKAEDLPKPVKWTIAAVRRESIKDQRNGNEEAKWTLYFEDSDQGLVLNKTNIHQLDELYGDDTDKWIGREIVLFNDPSVFYQGKSGGIRVRLPKGAAPPKPEIDDEIPF